MSITRHATRPMLAAVFVSGGIDTLRHPAPRVAVAADVATATAEALPVSLPDDPETLVKLDATAKIAGGLMLASGGRLARLGALVCAASLVPTTIAGHPFWNEPDPQKRAGQQADFAKNLSLLGGLLIAALDTDGRPSVSWRAKRAARKAQGRITGTDGAAARLHDTADTVQAKVGALGADLSTRAAAAGHELAGRAADLDVHDIANRVGTVYERSLDRLPI